MKKLFILDKAVGIPYSSSQTPGLNQAGHSGILQEASLLKYRLNANSHGQCLAADQARGANTALGSSLESNYRTGSPDITTTLACQCPSVRE